MGRGLACVTFNHTPFISNYSLGTVKDLILLHGDRIVCNPINIQVFGEVFYGTTGENLFSYNGVQPKLHVGDHIRFFAS